MMEEIVSINELKIKFFVFVTFIHNTSALNKHMVRPVTLSVALSRSHTNTNTNIHNPIKQTLCVCTVFDLL